MKTLLIVESPTKAKKIQEFLDSSFTVLASRGHIADLAKGGKFGLGVDINNNFKPRYILLDDKVAILDQLMAAAKLNDQILLGTDPDKEGESIAFHLLTRLQAIGKPIQRITFNEIKKAAILKAIKSPRDINMDLFASQEARRILDRIVGFRASPFLMNFLGNHLSAGRVQSVVARMVIDREQEISQFKPETYWNIQANLSKDAKRGFTAKYHGKIVDTASLSQLQSVLNDPKTELIITELISAEEKEYPPPPLITSSLQRLMSKNHNISPDKTMRAAQTLYELGYCSYIRSDSTRIEKEPLQELREFIQQQGFGLPSKPYQYKNQDNAQDAHECIRPIDMSLHPDNNYAIIDADQKLVYRAIWKYFIACQMLPAIFNTLKITLTVVGHPKITFKVSGKALKELGYLAILGINNKISDKIDLPPLDKGDRVKYIGAKPLLVDKKQTQPPPRFSEDKLIKELETRGIGRPATYAELLNKIITRNYVERKNNIYYPTELGKKVNKALIDFFTFMKYDYTANMEDKLDLIAQGKLNKLQMLNDFYSQFKIELAQAYQSYGSQICDQCGSFFIERISKHNGTKFLGCRGYPNCLNTKPI